LSDLDEDHVTRLLQWNLVTPCSTKRVYYLSTTWVADWCHHHSLNVDRMRRRLLVLSFWFLQVLTDDTFGHSVGSLSCHCK